MAALTTFAELMARASATVFSQLYSNALEKAQQQHQLNIQSQQQTIAPFPIIPALMASVSIPTGMPCISPISQQQQVIITTNENKVKEEKRLVEQENGNCSNKINRKRKRSKNNNNNETKTTIQQTIKVEEKTTQQQQQQIKQEQCCSNNSSPSLANTSRISSPDSTTVHKGRKLKLYAAEEKTDIIDYAKCIGNRAAGREFNVAESSIREWRKNEDKIRKQAETTAGCTQHFEKNQKEILTRIDDELVRMLNSKDKRCTTWYGIAEQVNSLWENIAKELSIENSQMKITMGWVSRFMRRNEQRVPKVTPPIIATSYSNTTNTGISISSSSNSSLSNTSTRKSNNACNATASKQQPIETKTKSKSKAAAAAKIKLENNENNITENNELKCSRRKRFRPVRVNAECATLITSFAIKEEIQQNCES